MGLQTIIAKIRSKLLAKDAIPIVLLILLGILPLTWFRGDHFLVSLDSIFPLNVNSISSGHYGYIWDFTAAPGTLLGRGFPHLLDQTVIESASRFGIPLIVLQKAEFFFSFVVAGGSMYYLTRTIFSSKSNSRIIAMISALFYLFNPYAMLWIWHDHLTSIFFICIIAFNSYLIY